MLRNIFLSVFTIALFLSNNLIAHELPGVLVKKNLKIEFQKGYGCMTQTRAVTKEEAMYTVDQCDAVKYELSKKGKRFSIYEKNDGRWSKWRSYKVEHSLYHESVDDMRFTFLTTDGSTITFMPKTPSGKLVVLDLIGEEVVHFVYDEN